MGSSSTAGLLVRPLVDSLLERDATKALEIDVVVNNISTEGEVRTNVFVKEMDSLEARVVKLEADLAGSRTVVEEKDLRIASLEKKAVDD